MKGTIEFNQEVFTKLEETFGGGISEPLTSNEFVSHVAPLTLRKLTERYKRTDAAGTRTDLFKETQGKESAEWEYKGILTAMTQILQGGIYTPTAPEHDAFLQLVFAKHLGQQATVQANPVPTKSVFAILPANAVQPNDMVLVNGEIDVVISNDNGTIEILMGLKNPPSAGDTVYPMTTYYLVDDTNKTLFIAKCDKDGGLSEFVDGAICTDWSITPKATDNSEIECKGVARYLARAAADTLLGAIDEDDIELQVKYSEAFDVGAYIVIGSEIMKITALNHIDGKLTVTRGVLGSTAAAHDANSPILAYSPERRDTLQRALVADTERAMLMVEKGEDANMVYDICLTDLKVEGAENSKLITDAHTDKYPTRPSKAQKREVKISFEGYLDTDAKALQGAAEKQMRINLFYQIGSTVNNSFAFIASGYFVENPDINDASDGEIKIKGTFIAKGTDWSSPRTELIIGWA